jgi:hypothetical protein
VFIFIVVGDFVFPFVIVGDFVLLFVLDNTKTFISMQITQRCCCEIINAMQTNMCYHESTILHIRSRCDLAMFDCHENEQPEVRHVRDEKYCVKTSA